MTSVTPESKVKAKLKAWLRERGCYHFMPVQTGLGSTTLDVLVCNAGRFHAYECKAPGRKLTPRQELVSKQIMEAGGNVWVVTLDNNGNLLLAPCGLIKDDSS